MLDVIVIYYMVILFSFNFFFRFWLLMYLMMFVQAFSVFYVRELVETLHQNVKEDPVAAFEDEDVCSTQFGLYVTVPPVFS